MGARAPIPDPVDLTGRRIEAVLAVARSLGTVLEPERLTELLPENGPDSPTALATWLREHPTTLPAAGTLALGATLTTSPPALEARRQRGRRYLGEATALLGGALRPAVSLARCVAVTGSTAYGEPDEGDDLDFLVVTRAGAVWAFLAYVYLALRLRRGAKAPVEPCFNYVMDERRAGEVYGTAHDFLFAREALVARVLEGEPYYRGLLGSAGWIRRELPRLYRTWERESFPPSPQPRPAGWAVRLLNLALYPWIATYLQVQGLRRNRAFRREGHPERAFRTVTRLDRLAFETDKYERLTRRYAPARAAAGSA